MFGGPLAGVGTRTDAGDAHLAHVPLHGLAVDDDFLAQFHRDLARAIERVLGVDFVDAPFDEQFFRRSRHGRVVQAGAVEREQVALGFQAQFGIVAFQQGQAFSAARLRGQIFF